MEENDYEKIIKFELGVIQDNNNKYKGIELSDSDIDKIMQEVVFTTQDNIYKCIEDKMFYLKYKSFDFEKFKKEFSYGDLSGLEYLRDTIMKEIQDYLNSSAFQKLEHFTKEEYIMNLYRATMNLNYCNDIYENESSVKTRFNYDYYSTIRDLLFTELGFNLDKLYEEE